MYSLSDEVIEQLRQAAITNPMQAAYDTVCARFKCYKGAARTQQTYRAGTNGSVGSHYSTTREDDSFED
eukprot:257869-Karenia_brevis.AAC.1